MTTRNKGGKNVIQKGRVRLKDIMFSVELQKNGELREILSTQFTETAGDGRTGECTVYTYIHENDSITINIRTCQSNEETLLNAEVSVQGPSTLVSFQYPGVTYGDISIFDNLLMSSPWGDNIERPTKTIRDVSTSTSIRFDQDYIKYAPNEVIYTYPSIMAMQYMTIYNHSRSFYMASYSQSDETETFHAKVTGKYELSLSIKHYPFINNSKWSSPQCSIATLGGGWHAAAKLYAFHMNDRFRSPDSPDWMRKSYHGWVEFMMKRENEPLAFTFAELPGIYRDVFEKTGINHLFIAGWHDDGHDTKFPRYVAHEPAGSPQDLKNGADMIKDMGGRISLYTNGRLVDIEEEYYKEKGYRAVSLDEHGKPYHESYGTKSVFAVTCPGCSEYCEHMAGVTKRICSEYGAHGMFIDQISCNLAPMCYNSAHNHTKPSNNFLSGIEEELKAIRSVHQEIDREFHSFSEGCHERFGQFYDVNQGHGEEYTWQIGKSMPEQFLYTFPDRIVTGHCADKSQMYHSMAQFKPLDIKDTCYADHSNHSPIKQYIILRDKYKKYFLQGRFQDDEGFVYSADMRLFATQANDGSLCTCLFVPGSIENTENRGYIKMPERCNSYQVIFPQPTKASQDGDWISVGWTGALCYIIFSYNK